MRSAGCWPVPAALPSLTPSPRGPTSIDARGTSPTPNAEPLRGDDRVRLEGGNGVCYFVDGLPATNLLITLAQPAEAYESVEVTRNDASGTLRKYLLPGRECKMFVVLWTRR